MSFEITLFLKGSKELEKTRDNKPTLLEARAKKGNTEKIHCSKIPQQTNNVPPTSFKMKNINLNSKTNLHT